MPGLKAFALVAQGIGGYGKAGEALPKRMAASRKPRARKGWLSHLMEELEITLGQRALPSIHGEQTMASSYAGLGSRHLLILADGAAGEVPSRLAAQTACSAAMARIRASVLPDFATTLAEAFAEANAAVRRVLIGTAAEGKGQAALLVVVIDAAGVAAARVGGGRVYLLRGDRLDALYRGAGPEGLGGPAGASIEPEIVAGGEALGTGDRILILSESAVRPLAADLERLGSGAPPQLVAGRMADAARRRGQLDPVSVHVVEIAGDAPRIGPHPAIARIERGKVRTFDPEGRLMGRTVVGHTPNVQKAQTGLVAWFVLAVLLGIGAALVIDATRTRKAPDPASPPGPVAVLGLDTITVDEVDAVAETVNEVETTALEPEVMALFEAESAARLSKGIRSYITRRFPEDGEVVFARLEAGIIAHGRDPKVIEALLELVREPELKRTARWVQDLLPRLYAQTPEPATP